MPGEPQLPPEPPDHDFKRLVTWVLIALILSILAAVVGVELAIYYFDRP